MDNTILYNGDCLELMANIQDHSVDLILCDLPYGTTACAWEICDKKFLVHRKVFDYGYAKNNIYGNIRDMKKPDDGTRNPISVVSYEVPFIPLKGRVYDSDIDLRCHPTQKPVELLEYLIRTYSNAGDVVLDNTMGSGSTGVACVNTDRKFIGIELDENYFEIAKKRISDAETKSQNNKNSKSLF